MCDLKFVNLHNHTSYSPDGLTNADRALSRVKELNQSAFAVTDHATASSYIELYNAAKRLGVKPIFGNEFYLDYLMEKDNTQLFHLTVLAYNKTGYENIIKLNNQAHQNVILKRGSKYPTINLDMLSHYQNGLYVLTGCPASVLIDSEDESVAMYYVQQLKTLMQSNVAIELMFTYKPEFYVERVLAAKKYTGLPIVITNDSHYTYKSESTIHPLTVECKKGWSYASDELYIKSADEIYEVACKYLPKESAQEYINYSSVIADKVEPFSVEEKATLPKIPDNAKDVLYAYYSEQLAIDKLKHSDIADELQKRFDLEWEVVNKMDFLSYFYIIYDINEFAKSKGIFVRVRGSGGGCYLVYLMGIMTVHPVIYHLPFDRFINYERTDYPDLDLDFAPNRRSEIFDYARSKWGMLPVSTFAIYKHKSIVHDICRILRKKYDIDVPKAFEHDVAGWIDEDNDDDTDEGGTSAETMNKFIALHPVVKPMYDAMLGTIRSRGKHAAAIAAPVTNCPMECWTEDNLSLAWSESGAGRKDLQTAGLVKIDILGVSVLNVIAMLRKTTGVTFDLSMVTPGIFEPLQQGHTTGLFQFKSKNSIKLGKLVKADSLSDISAIVALNRPGPLDSGMAWEFPKAKENPRRIHPSIDHILEETYGIIVYQEQVMELYSFITNEGASGRNDARKILVPKSLKILDDPKFIKQKNALKDNFFTKGQQNGYTVELLERIWSECDTFGRYGFNKSHSIAYGFITLEMLYYMVKHPLDYYCALLNCKKLDKEGKHQVQLYLYDMLNLGIKIMPPHINISTDKFEVNDGKIYLPLQVIDGISETTVTKILELRQDNITSVKQLNSLFPKKVLNAKVRLHLYVTGGLHGLEGDIKELGIDDSKLSYFETLTKGKRDLKVFGFVLPNDEQRKAIEQVKDVENTHTGFIVDAETKLTKSGKKKISYRLFPYGYFSQFDNEQALQLELGQFLGVKTNMYGFAESIKFGGTTYNWTNNMWITKTK